MEFPDLPGCISAGSTLEEARQMAEEALAAHAAFLREDGDEVPFTESMKQQLLDIPTMATAIIVAYFDSLTGVKTKNF